MLKCPECDSDQISVTLLGMWVVGGKPRKDTANTATCHECGCKDEAWKFGAEDTKPMSGTEDWTEEQVKQYWEDFMDGKISFKEEIGPGFCNTGAIANIRLDKAL